MNAVERLNRIRPGAKAEFIALWRDRSIPGDEIGKRFGMSYGGVYTIAKRFGLPGNRGVAARKPVLTGTAQKIVIEVMGTSKPDVDIARDLGCSREYVGQVRSWLSANNIVMQKGAA